MKDWIPDRYRELRSLVSRDRIDEDVAEELAYHIEMRVRENLDAGMSEAEARAEALRRFGDLERVKRETKEVDRRLGRRRDLRDRLEAAWREARLAGRGLARRPGFALVALLTLALGIGAVSAIFTVLDRVVLTPLPYPDADRLVRVQSRVPYVGPDAVWGASVAGYFAFQQDNRTLAAIGAYSRLGLNVSGGAATGDAAATGLGGTPAPARVRAAVVTASLMDVLKARPAVGRLIQAIDDVPNGPDVVVLGYGFWQRRYGGDPAVVGSTVELNGRPFEVIGVMAEGVGLPDQAIDIWEALGLDPAARPVNAHWLSVIGRLQPGATVESAQADLSRLTAGFAERFPGAYGGGFMEQSGFATEVVPLKDYVIGSVSRALWILFASVGLVLLIAGANVTNLFLVRTEGRRRELAVRSALGASRGQIAWHYLSESLMLSLAAGGLALVLAYAAVRVLTTLSFPVLPRLSELALDGRVVLFTAGISLLLGLLLGGLPLLVRLVDYGALRESGRGLTASRGRSRTRRALVAGQVALALVLMAAAGLMLRSFQALRSVDPGFDPTGVLTLEVSLPSSKYSGFEPVSRFYHELLERVAALPSVTHAGATTVLPLKDHGPCALMFVEDRPPEQDATYPCLGNFQATPGFFEALGIPVRGRSFDWSEVEHRAGGVVVTRALAERFWPGEDPIGKGIRGNGPEPPFYRVIGVASDYRSDGLDRPPPQAVFFPMLPMEGAQLWTPPRSMTLVVKTATARPEKVIAPIRRIVSQIDPTVPIANIRTMQTVIDDSPSVARASFTMLLLGIAGAMALLLSAVGIYGVIAYVVGERMTEIGVRVALGARVGRVVGLVLGQSLGLTLIGLAVGLAGAFALTRLLRSLLFEVSPTDPLTLGAAAGLLLLIAVAASLGPARRAARVDPAEALKAE